MARILQVGKGAPERGGIPSFIADVLAGSWDPHTMEFANLAHTGERQGGQFTTANVRRTIADVRRVLRADADIVHVHSALAPTTTMVRALALCRVAGTGKRKVILHAHGGRVVDWADRGWRRRLLASTLARADVVIAVSSGVATTLAASGHPVEHLTNGVDTEKFRPGDERSTASSDAGPPTILYVGHLSERKGVLDLLEASRLLERGGVRHRLRLVGGVPDEGGDEAAILAAVTESTEVVGLMEPNRLPAMYREADVFCLASWWEATPLTVLEAMASGTPVVATDVGDVAEMVSTTGWIVAPRSPRELAGALAEALAEDPDARRARGEDARHRVQERNSMAILYGKLHAIYDRLATGASEEGG